MSENTLKCPSQCNKAKVDILMCVLSNQVFKTAAAVIKKKSKSKILMLIPL